MIVQLAIRNLIVVEEAFLELGEGLNVLTGTTGSGKSVLLAALALLAGERAKSDWIGPYGDRAEVEALLEIREPWLARVREMGFAAEEGQLALRREIRPGGKGQAFLDGRMASVGTLRQLGALLFERQDQHEQLRLLDPSRQTSLLDDFGDLGPLLDSYRHFRERHAEILDRERKLRARLVTLRGEEEFLRFQLEEIDRLAPEPGEKEDLEFRERRMRRSSRIQERLSEALDLLEDGQSPVLEGILSLDKVLERLASLEDGEPVPGLEPMILELRDLAEELRERSRSLEAEALEAGEISRRLSALHGLERKHRKDLGEILAWAEEQREALAELERGEAELRDLAAGIADSRKELSRAASRLSRARRKVSRELAEQWQSRLALLGMEAATLRLQVEPRAEAGGWIRLDGMDYRAGSRGMDQVSVRIRTNPDQEEGTLREIPSGGELSRIALACRLLPGLREGAPVLLLDEVDAGLGADLAPVLAARLLELAGEKQLLLVTHQAVLASAAHRQFRVSKRHEGKSTRVEVSPLEGEERLQEIIRMLGGGGGHEIRRHAESLLERAASARA